LSIRDSRFGPKLWIPAFARMTEFFATTTVILAKAAVRRFGIQNVAPGEENRRATYRNLHQKAFFK